MEEDIQILSRVSFPVEDLATPFEIQQSGTDGKWHYIHRFHELADAQTKFDTIPDSSKHLYRIIEIKEIKII